MTALTGKMQQRRDTAANWTSNNPTLTAGELGLETDTKLTKMGDGSTAWTSLPYTGGASAWTAPSFLNSWVDFGSGYAVCKYRKVGDVVQLRGTMSSGTVGSAAFTLPTGFRPPADNLIFAVFSNGTIGRCDVRSDGNVVPTTPSNNNFVAISGIWFSTVA